MEIFNEHSSATEARRSNPLSVIHVAGRNFGFQRDLLSPMILQGLESHTILLQSKTTLTNETEIDPARGHLSFYVYTHPYHANHAGSLPRFLTLP